MQAWRVGRKALAVLAVIWGGVQLVGHETGGNFQTDDRAQAAEVETVIALAEVADNGRTVVVPIGAKVTITLQSNPTTGYQWEIVDPLPSCLAVIAEPSMVAGQRSETLVGAPGQWRATLRAERRGEGTVLITYQRAWEKQAMAAKSFRVTVRVE